MAKKQQIKPKAFKATGKDVKRDTTVITPRYKVTEKELAKNVATVEKVGVLRAVIAVKKPTNGVDTTRLKIKANNQNERTTFKRNAERKTEGKSPLPTQNTIKTHETWVEPKGLSFKDRPIKTVTVKKPNPKKK